MKREFILYVDGPDGEVREIPMRTKMAVCPRCQGRGTHDCWEGGMTADEMWEQGDDFVDDYLDGVYSTTCTECDGRNVVAEVDEPSYGYSPEDMAILRAWFKQCEEEAADRRVQWAESGYGRY